VSLITENKTIHGLLSNSLSVTEKLIITYFRASTNMWFKF